MSRRNPEERVDAIMAELDLVDSWTKYKDHALNALAERGEDPDRYFEWFRLRIKSLVEAEVYPKKGEAVAEG